MRAISLWQPWASAVALGSKQIETRSWSTSYRGPLAIHAAKRKNVAELTYLGCTSAWRGSLSPFFERGARLDRSLPFGAVIAVVDLTDCKPVGALSLGEVRSMRRAIGQGGLYDWSEEDLGDFSAGRFGWVFSHFYLLPEPIPFRGRQGFFSVPDEMLPPEALSLSRLSLPLWESIRD